MSLLYNYAFIFHPPITTQLIHPTPISLDCFKKYISTQDSEEFLCLGLYHELQKRMQKVGYKNNLRNNYILGIARQFFKVTVLRLLVHFIRALCASYGIVIDLKEDRG